MEYFVIIIASIFVNNVVLSQFLGICPFLGVSSRVSTSVGMGAAVTFVMAISSVVAYLIQYYVLVPLHIEYMQTIIFILVIAALVQMVEIVLKKLSPALYQALGIFLLSCSSKKSTIWANRSSSRRPRRSDSRWLWCCSPVCASGSRWKIFPPR